MHMIRVHPNRSQTTLNDYRSVMDRKLELIPHLHFEFQSMHRNTTLASVHITRWDAQQSS